jgi:hypothetical protein
MRSARCAIALMLAALFGATAACDDQDATQKSIPSDGYYIARYDGDNSRRDWKPANASHNKPPKSAAMMIYEVTRHAFQKPTYADRKAAAELVWACERAYEKKGWLDFDATMAKGFEKLYGDELHYVNRMNLFDDRLMDCERPEFLLYDPVDHHLLGVMFLARTPTEHGPQPGGPETVWHYHLWAYPRCVERDLLIVGVVDDKGECASGQPSQRSAEMMHVWFIDHPNGRFATRMGPGGQPRKRK